MLGKSWWISGEHVPDVHNNSNPLSYSHDVPPPAPPFIQQLTPADLVQPRNPHMHEPRLYNNSTTTALTLHSLLWDHHVMDIRSIRWDIDACAKRMLLQ